MLQIESTSSRIAIVFFVVACLLLSGCTNLFLFPSKPHLSTPNDFGLQYEDITLSVPGAELNLWRLLPTEPRKGVVLHLHGNAENISTHIGSVSWLPQHGYEVYLLDYRGYGRSTGRADVSDTITDVELVLEYILAHTHDNLSPTDPKPPFIIFGQSLGGAIGIFVAAHSKHKHELSAVVVDSAFSSYRQIAREKLYDLWITWPMALPVSFLFSDLYSPEKSIDKVSKIPLILTHSTDDKIVPFHHSQILFDKAREPKQLWLHNEIGHTSAFRSDILRKKLLREFEKLP